MSKIKTRPISPRTACGNSERELSSRSKKEPSARVNSKVTMTAAVQRNHSRLSMRPILVPIVSVGMLVLISTRGLLQLRGSGSQCPGSRQSQTIAADYFVDGCRLRACADPLPSVFTNVKEGVHYLW